VDRLPRDAAPGPRHQGQERPPRVPLEGVPRRRDRLRSLRRGPRLGARQPRRAAHVLAPKIDEVGVVPVAESVTCDLIGVDVLDAVAPTPGLRAAPAISGRSGPAGWWSSGCRCRRWRRWRS
jgi:hypothetical protein